MIECSVWRKAAMKEDIRRRRVELLQNDFKRYLEEFDRNCPFSPSQRDCHRSTIQLRRELGAAVEAIKNKSFLEDLRHTLTAWRVGTRGTVLVGFDRFKESLNQNEKIISELDGLSIEDERVDLSQLTKKLWALIAGLDVVVNTRGEKVSAPIVSGTKTLLHIMPDLVPPMDREYTQAFFGWHNPEFQYRQEYCFRYIYNSLATIARKVKPSKYIGTGWHSSTAKLLDSALVGFCLIHHIEKTP
jgi:hypothetical protein